MGGVSPHRLLADWRADEIGEAWVLEQIDPWLGTLRDDVRTGRIMSCLSSVKATDYLMYLNNPVTGRQFRQPSIDDFRRVVHPNG